MNRPHTAPTQFMHADHRGNFAMAFTCPYNPERVLRTIVPSGTTGEHLETLQFELVLDATEGLEQDDSRIEQHGIAHQLAALRCVFEDTRESSSGGFFSNLRRRTTRRIPVLLLGSAPPVPVRLARFNSQEYPLDGHLNPLHAVIELKLKVLTRAELTGHRHGLRLLDTYTSESRELAAIGGCQPL